MAELTGEARARYVRAMFGRIVARYDLMNTLLTAGLDRAWRRTTVRMAAPNAGGLALDVACGTGALTRELARYPLRRVVGLDFTAGMLEEARRPSPPRPLPHGGRGEFRDIGAGKRTAWFDQPAEMPDDWPLATHPWSALPASPLPPSEVDAGSPHDVHIASPTRSYPLPPWGRGRGGEGRAPTSWVQGDALALPFPDDTFDCVTIGFGLRNFGDLRAGLAELLRVTRPGGRLAALECTPLRDDAFGRLVRLYFHGLVPLVGQVVAGSREAYGYLPSSVDRFPNARALADLLREVGWADVRWRAVGLGVVLIHHAAKPLT